MNSSILTLILLTPLAGAVLVALMPDRGKLPAWIALLTTLVTFGLTLHLPAHFDACTSPDSSSRSITRGSRTRRSTITLVWTG